MLDAYMEMDFAAHDGRLVGQELFYVKTYFFNLK